MAGIDARTVRRPRRGAGAATWVVAGLATLGAAVAVVEQVPHRAVLPVVAVGLAACLQVVIVRREASVRAARDELAAVAEQFRGIFDHSPVAIGVADAHGHLVAVNAALARLVGRRREELLGASDLAYTHPDDRPGHAGTGALIEGARDGVASLEKRYVRPDGTVRHVWLSLTHVPPPAGVPGPWTLAHVQDVTARHEAEQALRDSERDLTAVTGVARRIRAGGEARTTIVEAVHGIAGAGSVSVIEPVADEDALVITASVGVDMVGTRIPLTATSVTVEVFRTGRPVFLADPDADPLVSPALLARSGARSLMWQPVVTQGRTTAVLAVSWDERVASREDRRARAVELLADEAALALDHERLLERLEQLAHTDQLTGLPNRHAWHERLPGLMALGARAGRPLVVAVVDLDRFKVYNDVRGHLAGDDLLRRAAAGLRGALRVEDLVARWGGEEFVVALPGAAADAAERVLDRVRGAMPDGQTCSIGYAVWNGLERPEALLERADAALYEAKRAGRDRVAAAAPVVL